MIRGEITKTTSELVSLSQRIENADLTFGGIRKSLDLLEHYFVCVFHEIPLTEGSGISIDDAPLPGNGPHILMSDYGLTDFNSIYRASSATYHTAHSNPQFFPNLLVLAIPPPLIGEKSV